MDSVGGRPGGEVTRRKRWGNARPAVCQRKSRSINRQVDRHPPSETTMRPHLLLFILLPVCSLQGQQSPAIETLVPVSARESLLVTTAGTGPTIVLVPGLFGSAFGYRHLLQLLPAAGFQAVVIEPLGVGRSPRPRRADYSLTAQADRLAAVLHAGGGKPVVI